MKEEDGAQEMPRIITRTNIMMVQKDESSKK